MVLKETATHSLTRRGEGRCPRCGKPADGKFISCSSCLRYIREHEAAKKNGGSGRRNLDPTDGWDNTLPMERPLGTDNDHGTYHRPGSLEKVLLMAKRYAAGKPLFHSDDAKGAEHTETSGNFSKKK